MKSYDEKKSDPAACDVRSMVIPVHCSGSSRQQWQPLAESTETRLQVCPVELIGCGVNDDWHGRGPITLSAQATLVEATAAKSFGPVHPIGHSHGGAVTLAAAMVLGERVARPFRACDSRE